MSGIFYTYTIMFFVGHVQNVPCINWILWLKPHKNIINLGYNLLYRIHNSNSNSFGSFQQFFSEFSVFNQYPLWYHFLNFSSIINSRNIARFLLLQFKTIVMFLSTCMHFQYIILLNSYLHQCFLLPFIAPSTSQRVHNFFRFLPTERLI